MRSPVPGRTDSEQQLCRKSPVGPGGQQTERELAETSTIPGCVQTGAQGAG